MTMQLAMTHQSPRGIFGSRLKVDINADRDVFLTGGVVSAIKDQANGIYLTQSTAGARPAVVAGVGGHTAIRFDGTDDVLLSSAGFSSMAIDTVGVYAIYTWPGGTGNAGGPYEIYRNTVTYGALYPLYYFGTLYCRRNNGSGSYNELGGSSDTVAGTRLLSARLANGAEGINTILQRDNTLTLGSAAQSGGFLVTPDSIVLGRENSGPYYCACDFYRLIVVQPCPTIAEHAALIAYLRAAYPSIAIAP